MFNSLDEISVVLRAHLILEEFLNIWCSRTTSCKDLFEGAFVPFKTKLAIAKNLGLPNDIYDVIDKFNAVRNRYSHKRKYALEKSSLESLRLKVDALASDPPMHPCDQYHIFAQFRDQFGRTQEVRYDWASSDTKKRVLLVFVQFVMKLVQWMQMEFNRRNIPYSIIAWPNQNSPRREQ